MWPSTIDWPRTLTTNRSSLPNRSRSSSRSSVSSASIARPAATPATRRKPQHLSTVNESITHARIDAKREIATPARKIRSTKLETRDNFEYQIRQKDPNRLGAAPRLGAYFGIWGLGCFGFVSDFALRISDFHGAKRSGTSPAHLVRRVVRRAPIRPGPAARAGDRGGPRPRRRPGR